MKYFISTIGMLFWRFTTTPTFSTSFAQHSSLAVACWSYEFAHWSIARSVDQSVGRSFATSSVLPSGSLLFMREYHVMIVASAVMPFAYFPTPLLCNA